MDPRWLPWYWAAGAAGCGLVFFCVQPWRREWGKGWELVRSYPAAWGVAVGLWLVDRGVAWAWGSEGGGPPQGTGGVIALSAVRQALQGWTFGTGAGLLGALLLVFNVGGLRRGMLKGVESVTGGGAARWWLVVLLLGAVALGADLTLQGREVPAVWLAVVSALAVPLTGWVSAAVLGGWLLLAETVIRMPDKVSTVRWMESSAAHAARLWPWALAHGLGWWLARWLPAEAVLYAGWALTVGALGFGFLPLVFLHEKRFKEARQGLGQAMLLWRSHGWQPLVWLMGAGMIFTIWQAISGAFQPAGGGAQAAVRMALEAGGVAGQISLTFLGLGAWIALRLADTKPPPPEKRARKDKAL